MVTERAYSLKTRSFTPSVSTRIIQKFHVSDTTTDDLANFKYEKLFIIDFS